MPGSPTSSTSVPKPMRTGATDAARTARSRSRSTNGSFSVARPSSGRVVSSGASSPRTTACTGSLFPFTWNGSSSVASKPAPPRENALDDTLISSSPARAIRRAASAAVSPSTVYVLRNDAPTWPVNTRPSLTPMFVGSGRPASTTARIVRSIRSSTSPKVCGAPETRTILPPSMSTSLSRNVTWCSSRSYLDIRAHQLVERRRGSLRPFGGDHLVDPVVAHEPDGCVPVLALEWPDLEQLGTEGARYGHLDRKPLDIRQGNELALDVRCGTQQPTRPLLLTQNVVVEQLCRLRAEQDLARLGGGLHLDRSTCRRDPTRAAHGASPRRGRTGTSPCGVRRAS